MALLMLGDNVAIRKHKLEQTSKGGIALPGNVGKDDNTGTIVAIGPGRTGPTGELCPCVCSVGDIVVFGKYAGNTVKSDGETLCVMHERELVAVLEHATSTT